MRTRILERTLLRMGIAERLKWARDATGLSQRDLAELAGDMSEGVIRHLEAGITKTIEVPNAVKLCMALGCAMGWLLAGEGEAPDSEALKAIGAAAREAKGAAE